MTPQCVLKTFIGFSGLRLLLFTITLFLTAGKSFFLLIFIGQEKVSGEHKNRTNLSL